MKLGRLQGYSDQTGNVNGVPATKDPYVTADVLPADYDDISSIENFVNYYPFIQNDFGMKDTKCLQREIYAEALILCNNDLDTNWGNLSATEQKTVCQYCTSKIPINRYVETYPTAPERQAISQEFDSFNISSRKTNRYPIVRMYLFNKIGTQNALLSLKTADDDNLTTEWFGGIEGTVEDNGIVGLFDYILARAGTPYDITGLKAQTYPIIDGSGMTLAEVCDELYEIAKNGMY
jgi:hypothetical protein